LSDTRNGALRVLSVKEPSTFSVIISHQKDRDWCLAVQGWATRVNPNPLLAERNKLSQKRPIQVILLGSNQLAHVKE